MGAIAFLPAFSHHYGSGVRIRCTALTLIVLSLTGCALEPEPELVGATGDLHVSPDGETQFCDLVSDTGWGVVCRDGIETEGVDLAAIATDPGDTVIVDRRGDRPSSAGGFTRTLEDGTRVYSVFLVGTKDADTFTVSSVGTADYALPSEYQQPEFEVRGGFLVPVVPSH